jgi:NADPH:quinone reductase-like Zn-dependent oxidoreductase
VRVEDVPVPPVRPDGVLIRVHSTTVNRTDCGFRAAKPFVIRLFAGPRRPRHPVLGCEFAGVVEAVGGTVTRFQVGDRVFGYDDARFGGHAELVSVAEDSPLATVPEGVSFDEAAAGTEGSHHALSGIRKINVRGGDDVLVHGATGATGSAAVQLLTAIGARVTATSPTAQLDLVRGLGADRVIDHTAQDFTRDDGRYDVVIDAVGKSTFGRCRRLMKPGGTYLSTDLGPYLQNPLLPLVTPRLPGRSVRFPLPTMDPATVQYLRGLMATGAFRPVIDRTYPLEEIVAAYRYVETGQKVGNVVILV